MIKFTGKDWTVTLAIMSLSFIWEQALYGASKTSSASFLEVPVSAESIALGGNAVALGNGIGSVTENPAGLGFMRQNELQTSYGPYLGNYSFFNAAYGHRSPLMNAGLSLTRIAASDFEGRDEQGSPTSSFSAQDMAVSLSAAKTLANLSVGMNLKFISSRIADESASAMAVDAGVVLLGDRRAAYPYKLGFSIRNLGTPMKYMNTSEPLPLTASAALAVTVAESMEAGLNVSNNLIDNSFEFGVGMGFSLAENLSLTGGLSRGLGSSASSSSDSLPFRLNAGLGLKMSDFMLNYGFIPMGELGNIQRMSLTFKFGTDNPVRSGWKPSKNARIYKGMAWNWQK